MSRQDLRPSQTLKWKQFFILLMDPSGGSWLADSFLVTKIINKLTERKYRARTWITCLVNPYSFLWKQQVGWFVLQVWEVIPVFMINNSCASLPSLTGGKRRHRSRGEVTLEVRAADTRGRDNYTRKIRPSFQQLPRVCSFINIKTDGASQNIASSHTKYIQGSVRYFW